MNTQFKNLILKLSLTLGLVIVAFLLSGLTSKAEAAGSEFMINSKYTANDQRNSAVAVDSSNRFYVVWEDNGHIETRFDIFGRIFDSNGNAITTDSGALDDEH